MSMIEHIVVFKVKDDVPPSESEAMVHRINSLASLEHLLHLTMVPLFRFRSSSPSFHFTHILHSRYNSKDDLNAYTVHPSHVAAVQANSPLLQDIMAVDFVAQDLQGGFVPPRGSAVRVTLFKLKEGFGNRVKDEVLRAIKGIQDGFKEGVQFSCGENFSPGRAKGFSIGSIVVFPGLSELEGADADEGIEVYHKNDEIKEHLECVVLLDFVVPSP
ncbi:hypothetical protein TanjilG_26069 [Lupinus angustifolius]|uniref:Stress-response A/B barrel domain-containing protein n=1 Tax=Lupinus angustifolius TaxID=3871 RepID=A0A4P1R1S6_LUPAN|nr:PREDICTED: stress-response A/B barrel domain-containing protein UP3-like [Lupinus angustifolius]OIV99731.1 hypothetical protein TanjilG_26069 [Lupinus angustifolius]